MPTRRTRTVRQRVRCAQAHRYTPSARSMRSRSQIHSRTRSRARYHKRGGSLNLNFLNMDGQKELQRILPESKSFDNTLSNCLTSWEAPFVIYNFKTKQVVSRVVQDEPTKPTFLIYATALEAINKFTDGIVTAPVGGFCLRRCEMRRRYDNYSTISDRRS